MQIELYNNVEYASEHENGGQSTNGAILTKPQIRDASSVKVGGEIYSRPFMKPSTQVLKAPYKLLTEKLREFGWKNQ